MWDALSLYCTAHEALLSMKIQHRTTYNYTVHKNVGEWDWGKTKSNNWCEWKIIVPKSEQILRKLHGWTTENRTWPARSPRSLVLSHFSFVTPLQCSHVSKTHITRYYFCLSGITFRSLVFFCCRCCCTVSSCFTLSIRNSNCCFSEIIQHQIHGFHNCRFPEQSVLLTLFVCAHFSICIKTNARDAKLAVAIETVINFKGHFNQWTSFKHCIILCFERMSHTDTKYLCPLFSRIACVCVIYFQRHFLTKRFMIHAYWCHHSLYIMCVRTLF